MTRRVLLVDDEPPARQRMRRLLAAHDEVEIVGEAGDGVSALEAIERLRPDLVLLDIDMPELDGLGVAAALPAERPAIIFVTAYDEHALRAFELSAIDYLVKPVAAERLAAALGKVRGPAPTSRQSLDQLLAQLPAAGAPRRLAVRSGAKYLVFDPARVSAVLAADHYATILVDDRELLADEGLDALAHRLGSQFLRVHRSAVINLSFLRELVGQGDRKYEAVLADAKQTRVPVSRDRLAQLKAALGLTE